MGFLKINIMDTNKLEKFFAEYEKAFSEPDIKKNATQFADTFISAGPKGTIAQNKDEFLKKAGQASEFYKRVGQTSAKIISKKFSPIGDQYTLATIHWGVTFKKTGSRMIEFDISYIVSETGDKPQIILFISHEDEEEAMKKLGLMDKAMA
jgi:Domain of unknown function (DUF4440)